MVNAPLKYPSFEGFGIHVQTELAVDLVGLCVISFGTRFPYDLHHKEGANTALGVGGELSLPVRKRCKYRITGRCRRIWSRYNHFVRELVTGEIAFWGVFAGCNLCGYGLDSNVVFLKPFSNVRWAFWRGEAILQYESWNSAVSAEYTPKWPVAF